nr:hypothetical protein GCM10020093_116210 [Planobispora longispora]
MTPVTPKWSVPIRVGPVTRRAKIVCTLGPATSSLERLRELIAAGMDVARFNLSHGSHELHKEVYDRLKEAAADLGRGVGVLADLQGPKIRVGKFEEGPVRLGFGDVFTITTEGVPGDREQVSTTYLGLPKDVRPGDSILVDDGRVHLEVTRVDGPRVTTRVVIGGMISDNKGLNLPGVNVSAPALTDKDEADLRWALRTGFDLIALSFVRRPSDADVVRNIMEQEGVRLPCSPRSRSRRPSSASPRSSRPSTASWSPAATSASSSPRRGPGRPAARHRALP